MFPMIRHPFVLEKQRDSGIPGIKARFEGGQTFIKVQRRADVPDAVNIVFDVEHAN